MDLSIIIPAYNEARKVARDVVAAGEFLAANNYRGEVIVADDGSTDGTAAAAEAAAVPKGVDKTVLELPHRGKGATVRAGMVESRGDYAMFADSGLCVPFEDALAGLALLQRGECDVANGSRKLPDSVIDVPQTPYRRFLSFCFRRAVLSYLRLPGDLSDTQCGFKVYRGDVARELYGQCRTDGFLFDLEILMRAIAQGYSVKEFPVHWACDRDSRLKPRRILLSTFTDLRAVKRTVEAEPQPAAPLETTHRA